MRSRRGYARPGALRACLAAALAVGVMGGTFAAGAEPPVASPGVPVPPAAVPLPPAGPLPPVPTGPAVRVYVLNGMDPGGWGGLREMTDRLGASGYETRYGPWYKVWDFEREIRERHAREPGTPVAIIGYSFGAYRAKALANRLTRDGIPVAMVGYLGGDYLRNSPSDVPAGARVVNVRGNGFLLTGRNLFFNGADLSGADNLRLRANHFDLPKQQEALDALLAGLGGSVGLPAGVTPPGVSGTPSGRPSIPQPPSLGAGGGSSPLDVSPASASSAADAPPPPVRRSRSPAAAAAAPWTKK